MRNWVKRNKRKQSKRLKASTSGHSTKTGAVIVHGLHRPVAVRAGKQTVVNNPPRLKFTGRTASASEVGAWARRRGQKVDLSPAPDVTFAQVDAQSAIAFALWLKRFNYDTGYTYRSESRDCDNFSRRFRAAGDLFDAPVAAQAAVFGLYAQMAQPFAGVTDGVHALNAVWTEQGVFIFEPQGLDLTYQSFDDWPSKGGISSVLMD